jgi:hypothetical protein
VTLSNPRSPAHCLSRDTEHSPESRSSHHKGKGKARTQDRVAFPASTGTIRIQANINKHFFAIDTGCSDHCSFQRGIFSSLVPPSLNDPHHITVANGTTLEMIGIGSIELIVPSIAGPRLVVLKDALYVPVLAANLLSVEKLLESSAPVQLAANLLSAKKLLESSAPVQLTIGTYSPLFWLSARDHAEPHTLAPTREPPPSGTPPQEFSLWQLAHERLGHAGDNVVRVIFPDVQRPDGHLCIACERTKTTKVPIASEASPRDHPVGHLIQHRCRHDEQRPRSIQLDTHRSTVLGIQVTCGRGGVLTFVHSSPVASPVNLSSLRNPFSMTTVTWQCLPPIASPHMNSSTIFPVSFTSVLTLSKPKSQQVMGPALRALLL